MNLATTFSLRELQEEYRFALQSFFDGAGELALDQAYEVGRRAIENHLGVLDVTRIHQDALEHLMQTNKERSRGARWVKMASDVLSEALAPFEMTQRGYQETLEQLRNFNQNLEQQIDQRTRDLQLAEEKYRTLFENNPMPMWVNDLATLSFLAVNEAALEHYGYSNDEFLRMHWCDLLPGNGQSGGTVQEQLQRLADANDVWKHLTKAGALIDVAMNVHPITFGDQPALLMLANDITEKVHRERELEAIASVSFALRDTQKRAEMLPLILDRLSELIAMDAAALMLIGQQGEDLIIEEARGIWESQVGLNIALDRVDPKLLTEKHGTIVTDLGSQAFVFPYSWHLELKAVAFVPLITQGKTIGLLCMARNGEIKPSEVRLMASICAITVNAIYRATLYEMTEKRLQRIAALHAIDLAIGSSLDLHLTLRIFLDQVITQLGADAADVLLYNPRTQQLEYSAGIGFSIASSARAQVRLNAVTAGKSVIERSLISIPDLGQTETALSHAIPGIIDEYKAYYCTPLISKGQVQGVLEVFLNHPFKADIEWLDFLETLAGQGAIAVDDAALFNDLQRSNMELSLAYDATIEGWSRALDLRDKETEGHTQRVTDLTERLARFMGLSDDDMIHIHRGALLHDIGKMGVPDNILLKPGPLTDEEWVIMRKHPIYAYEMLKPITYLGPALDIPYCHHEKWDGSGYPRGLTGETIPLAARIFSVIDVWDALSSDRPYRPAWSEEKVLAYIQEMAGSHFDPRVVEAFLGLVKAG